MKHSDRRITTIPVHKNDPLPKGLLRKILREDIKINTEELKNLL
ncbi:MAG: type II toxin-antitoxin system HicA family toxin [Chitinophagales bacterium]|nr:type II toxin-antitoxin system HicA family toxin [Chitinophagales bacterium]